MLANFFNKTIYVRRLRTTSGNKKAYYATGTAEGTYQNVDDISNPQLEGIGAKNYRAWFDVDTDIKEGDQLIDSITGKKFRVIAVEKQGEGMGLSTEHLEVEMSMYSK